MGSGIFPVEQDSEDGKILLGLVEGIDDFIVEYVEYVYSGESGGNQFDNAARDGRYLEKLSLAARLLRECVSREE